MITFGATLSSTTTQRTLETNTCLWKTMRNAVPFALLVLSLSAASVDVNAYRHGRDLRPVPPAALRSRDGSLRFQQVAATGGDATGSATGAATGGATGGENTAKTKDEVLDKKEEMECLKQIKAGDKDKAAKTKRCHEQHQPRCPPPKNCWFAFLGMCKGEIKQPGVPCKYAEKKKPKVDESEPEADSAGTGPEATGSGASGPAEESGASGAEESGASGAEESGASGAAGEESGASGAEAKKS
eukprot:g16104.t1